jgi:RNA polymerase sigma-70 factor (ECF subfamily)
LSVTHSKLANYKTYLNQVKPDASLVRAYARGDASAFEMLYSRYKDQLFNSLFHQLGCNQSAAEEVAQEVWTAVVRSASEFREPSHAKSISSVRSWLFSIAHRRAADYWRGQYKGTASTSVEFNELEAGVTDQGSLTSEQEQQQFVREIRKLLTDLSEDQRQSFILSEEGFSYREIAEITETGVETVKSRLRYARNTLKSQLRDPND